MKKFYTTIKLVFLLLANMVSLFALATDIKKGYAVIEVNINRQDVTPNNTVSGLNNNSDAGQSAPDSISIWIETAPIFSGFYDNDTYQLHRVDRNLYRGEIPLELTESVAGIIIECGEYQGGSMVRLSQANPTFLEVTLSPEGTLTSIVNKDKDAYTTDDWEAINNVLINYYSDVTDVVADSLYADWEDVRKYQLDVMLPARLENAFRDIPVPESSKRWLTNNILTRFASLEIIPYVKAAERMNRLSVEEPPMAAYTFLDSISYTPEEFLVTPPHCGLKPFLYTLLRFPDRGFEKIGETPVREWTAKAGRKLSGAMATPPPLLLNLLSAMSYVEQIDVDRRNLTPVQVDNIIQGYEDDLGKIILAKDSLLRVRKKQATYDISDRDFNLKTFIDGNYKGRPVIVDMWNTWCSPCIDAIRQTKIIQKDLLAPDSDIALLYISDLSSPLPDWERMASSFESIQLRISSHDSDRLQEEYGITGFPGYLVFDRNHELMEVQTGVPATARYKEWLIRLQ